MPLLFVTALLVNVPTLGITADEQLAAVKAIEKLGGRVERDRSGAVVAVRLWYREASADDLKLIAKLTTLRELDLYETKIKDCDAALQHLAPLKRLTHLNLYDTGVEDEGLKALSKPGLPHYVFP